MYGWTDPNDPEGAKRRPEPPIEEPAWLTNRPAPRSAYLFGDDPEGPAATWHEQPATEPRSDDRPATGWRDEPTAGWAAGPASRGGQPSDAYHDLPTDGRAEPGTPWSGGWSAEEPAHRPTESPGGWRPAEETRANSSADWAGEFRPEERPGGLAGWSAEPSGWSAEPSGWSAEPVDRTGGWSSPGEDSAYGVRPQRWDAEPATASRWPTADETAPLHPITGDHTGERQRDAGGQTGVEGRHRSARRLPRALIIGGAAAAATLVVSLGVGALALPGGGGEPADPTAVDDTVAAAPALPTDTAPAPATTSASPTAAPSTLRPTPSASRT
ncbi:hypothetical protein E1211_20050, partial [Micromonospora sp. 15K316]